MGFQWNGREPYPLPVRRVWLAAVHVVVAVRSRLNVRRRRFRDIRAATQDGREDHGGHRGAERFAGMVVHRQIVSRAKGQRPLNPSHPARLKSVLCLLVIARFFFTASPSGPLGKAPVMEGGCKSLGRQIPVVALSAVQGGAPFVRWLARDPTLQHPEVGRDAEAVGT